MNRLGAVIVAAGCSSRMRAFKPMLRLGASTVIRTAILNILECSASPVIMVVGKNSKALAEHVADLPVELVHNLNYAHTDMLHSAKLGFAAIKGRAERCLFLPGDIPLFSPQSVALMQAYMDNHACDILIPSCKGKKGHPLLFKTALLDTFLAYEGKSGLRGAIEASGCERATLEVADSGILLDIDLREDYQLLRDYAETMSAPRRGDRVKISRHTLEEIFDEDMVTLLNHTAQSHSLTQACKNTGISYSAGWKKIKFAESQLGFMLVESNRGGSGGGNTELTAEAARMLTAHEKYRASVDEYAARQFTKIFCDNE